MGGGLRGRERFRDRDRKRDRERHERQKDTERQKEKASTAPHPTPTFHRKQKGLRGQNKHGGSKTLDWRGSRAEDDDQLRQP